MKKSLDTIRNAALALYYFTLLACFLFLSSLSLLHTAHLLSLHSINQIHTLESASPGRPRSYNGSSSKNTRLNPKGSARYRAGGRGTIGLVL